MPGHQESAYCSVACSLIDTGFHMMIVFASAKKHGSANRSTLCTRISKSTYDDYQDGPARYEGGSTAPKFAIWKLASDS